MPPFPLDIDPPMMKSASSLRLSLIFAAFALGYPAAAEGEKKLPPLKTGDIVFQRTATSASDAIMLASGTQYTHVGIVELDDQGAPSVIEAVGPVRVTPLETWVRNGTGRKITVKRIKGLHEANAKAALASAHKYLGRPYDHFFYESREQIYCSELVHLAFQEGANITVGKEEKVRDLNIDTGAAQKLIAQRWKAHPLCKSKGATNFKACYALILDQTLVTPASIARDPQLEMIYTNFGSEAE